MHFGVQVARISQQSQHAEAEPRHLPGSPAETRRFRGYQGHDTNQMISRLAEESGHQRQASRRSEMCLVNHR